MLILGNYGTPVTTLCVPKIHKRNNNGKLIDLFTCSSDKNHGLQCSPVITKAKMTKFGHPPYPRLFSFVFPQKCTYQPINTKNTLNTGRKHSCHIKIIYLPNVHHAY